MKLYNGTKHYNLHEMLKTACQWNGILSERSNGKSFAVMQYCFKDAIEDDREFALIYRMQNEITKADLDDYFTDAGLLKWLKKETGFDGVEADRFSKELFFFEYDADGKRLRGKRCGRAFAIETQRSKKSKHFDYIYNAIFEEFITDEPYLPNEWVKFNNLLSTIFRKRTDVKVFLLGNTVSRECPYLSEFGVDIFKIKKNSINVAELRKADGEKIRFAFEWAEAKTEEAGIFFGKASKEIVSGEWSADEYPHLFVPLKDTEILYTFYMINNLGNSWKCVLFLHKDKRFVYVYPYDRDEVQYVVNDVFTDALTEDLMLKNNYFIHPKKKIHKRILEIWKAGRFLYSTNLCGTEFNNSLKRYNPFR